VQQQTGLTEGQLITVGWVVIAVGIALWFFGAYVLLRVGRKFGIGSFGAYCVPVYNLILICRCAGLPAWVAIGGSCVLLNLLAPNLAPLFYAVTVGSFTYLWGTVAQRLGKSFWPWGVASAVSGIPIFFLAFDSSTPIRAGARPELDDNRVYDAVFRDDTHLPEGAAERSTLDGARPVMRCTVGEHAGETLELPSGGIVIGRDPAKSQLVLDSPGVSGQHAQIEVDPSDERMVVVTDLDSTNGTYVLFEITGGSPRWEVVRGSYSYPHSQPRRVRIGDGIAEFEIGSRG
jgi:hypothetical protein